MSEDYLIEYDNLKVLTVKDLVDKINSVEGKLLSELKIRDLTYRNNQPIEPGEGLYIFRKEGRVIYVGKASSMSFTERIGKHLDFRQKAWFNRMLKLVHTKELGRELGKKADSKNMLEASPAAASLQTCGPKLNNFHMLLKAKKPPE